MSKQDNLFLPRMSLIVSRDGIKDRKEKKGIGRAGIV
jgi:hypothetical protein